MGGVAPIRSSNGLATASLTVATPRERNRNAAGRRAMILAVIKHAGDIAAALPLVGLDTGRAVAGA